MFEFAKYHINIEFLKRTVVCLIWRRSVYLRCEEYQFFEQRLSQKVKLPVIRKTVVVYSYEHENSVLDVAPCM